MGSSGINTGSNKTTKQEKKKLSNDGDNAPKDAAKKEQNNDACLSSDAGISGEGQEVEQQTGTRVSSPSDGARSPSNKGSSSISDSDSETSDEPGTKIQKQSRVRRRRGRKTADTKRDQVDAAQSSMEPPKEAPKITLDDSSKEDATNCADTET